MTIRDQRIIGSQPKREKPIKKEDPKTEAVRQTLRGNPFGKQYHGKEYGSDSE
jgi:hypothetical protein